jgi:hypothetical protein
MPPAPNMKHRPAAEERRGRSISPRATISRPTSDSPPPRPPSINAAATDALARGAAAIRSMLADCIAIPTRTTDPVLKRSAISPPRTSVPSRPVEKSAIRNPIVLGG